MKTISKRQLQKMGEAVKPTEKTIKTRQGRQLAADVSKAVAAMENTSKSIKLASSEISESVLKLIKEPAPPVKPPLKKIWDFKIFRDKQGFIKNITATEI